MKADQELIPFPPKETLVAVGVFDGVHLGHSGLIKQLTALAHSKDMLSCIVTFSNHPRTVVTPGFEVKYITDPKYRVDLLKDAGADLVMPITFDHDLSLLSADQFVNLLQDRLRMKGMVMGQDFAMGHNREGDAETLKTMGLAKGFSVNVIDAACHNGENISSTLIRKLIADGMLTKARDLLGRPFLIGGRVVSGDSQGKTLGFPTANLDVDTNLLIPPDGIYATLVKAGNKQYYAASYIGTKPTFNGSKHVIETFLIDFNEDIYGSFITIDFIERIREDQSFYSSTELIEQMKIDVEYTLDILKLYTQKN